MSDGETARRAGTGASGRERRLAHEAALEEHNHELRSANKRLLARASQLEERVAARTAELAEARAQASASHREQGVFLASASHELRTPLNAILGYAEMLIEDHERGESMTVQDVVHIRDSARQLLEMINDVLDLSKIEAGRMELVVESFDPRGLLEHVMATMRPLAAKRENSLRLRCPDALPPMRTDAAKVRQILLNLMSNACKFTERGEVSLTVTPYVERDARWIALAVKDDGVGIPSTALPRLFEAFSQASAQTARRYGGTGLGLAITWRLCRMLGGVIEVESVEGVGSEFTIRLPVDRELEPWREAQPGRAARTRRAN